MAHTELAAGMATDTTSLRKQTFELGQMGWLGLQVVRTQPLTTHKHGDQTFKLSGTVTLNKELIQVWLQNTEKPPPQNSLKDIKNAILYSFTYKKESHTKKMIL